MVARNAAVASASADSKGWFSLSVPPGDYTLYSRMTTKSLDLEWIEPVSVDDRTVEIDLNEKRARGLLPR